METYNVKIEGTTPLLMNRFREAEIEGKSKKKVGEEKEKEIEDKLYTLEDGTNYIPAVYFWRSLIDAGKRLQIRGQGKARYSKLVGSVIEINPEAIPLKGKWVVYRVSAVNPMTRGRIMIERPKFDKWSCEFEVSVTDDESIGGDTLNELLVRAGQQTGVGDWRPEKKGKFGKFMVTSFKKK